MLQTPQHSKGSIDTNASRNYGILPILPQRTPEGKSLWDQEHFAEDMKRKERFQIYTVILMLYLCVMVWVRISCLYVQSGSIWEVVPRVMSSKVILKSSRFLYLFVPCLIMLSNLAPMSTSTVFEVQRKWGSSTWNGISKRESPNNLILFYLP